MSERENIDHPPGAQRPLAAIILAAGKGTRMSGAQPKVVRVVAGRAMVQWVVDAVRQAGAERIVLIVGYGAEKVRGIFRGNDEDIDYVLQDQQLGTGHATLCAAPVLSNFPGDVLVLAGDGPLIRSATIRDLHQRHVQTNAAATLATSVLEDPAGYGRVMRDSDGRFAGIVEHKNATSQQRQIREIYPSYACFDAKLLFAMLHRLDPDRLSGEYYITEIPRMMREAGHRVELIDAVPPEDVLSINTDEQLAQVNSILTERLEASSR